MVVSCGSSGSILWFYDYIWESFIKSEALGCDIYILWLQLVFLLGETGRLEGAWVGNFPFATWKDSGIRYAYFLASKLINLWWNSNQLDNIFPCSQDLWEQQRALGIFKIGFSPPTISMKVFYSNLSPWESGETSGGKIHLSVSSTLPPNWVLWTF